MRQSVIVLDGFYEDPEAVRRCALSMEYQPRPDALYPGGEAIAPGRDWSAEWKRLRQWISDDCDAPCPKTPPFPQGKFRLAMAKDESERPDRVHVDVQKWSAIIYLTLPRDCRGGLALYRNRETGAVVFEKPWFRRRIEALGVREPTAAKDAVREIFKDPANFEQIGLIPLHFNRAIILMAHAYHGTGVAFGDSPETGRLTQHFEFYSP